jgi:hypothetical protein
MVTQLRTTLSELDALQAAEEKTRRNAAFVKVPRTALQHLIMDHIKMYSLCKTQVVEPVELG